MASYQLPPIELLKNQSAATVAQKNEYTKRITALLQEALNSFNIDAKIVSVDNNDFAVLFRIAMGRGESARRVLILREDLELHLGTAVEILLVEGGHILIAAKKIQRPILNLRQIISSSRFQQSRSKVLIAAGMNLLGNEFYIDLEQVHNLLIAGTTGSGKSTFISDILLSILYKAKPEEVKLILIDTKNVEFQPYTGIPHLLVPPVADPDHALDMLGWANKEAQKRLSMIKMLGCETLEQYQSVSGENIPRIVIVIDEFMDLIGQSASELENCVRQIASRSAKTGIHLVLATQRPSKDVISPQIKASIPCRASFTVVDKRESKIALDRFGAERLLSFGDMIFSEREDPAAVHAQAAYVSYEEVDAVIDYWKNQV